MIRLHHMPRSRSVRVIWLCEEMGVPYETVAEAYGGPSDALKAHNPAATVPILLDGETVLFELVVMLDYIADRYGPTPLALKPEDPRYWAYREMLMFGEATLAAPLNALMATGFYAPEDQRDNYTADYIRKAYAKRLGVVSRRLEKGPYMAGEDFTLADISVAYPLSLGLKVSQFGLKDLHGDDIRDYYARVSERPAFKRMVAVR